MLEHGGRLREAAHHFGIPLQEWIDLSTGINPHGFVPPILGREIWQRLPEEDDGLETAAAAYYSNPRLLPVPGSQAAIQALPRLFPPGRIAMLAPGYSEHMHAWRMAGHHVEAIGAAHLEDAAARCDGVVLCNPNNPDATSLAPERLLALARRGVRLVVDEAFIDATPEVSLTPLAASKDAPNLIVLRSLGKFFGLAGARVGFIFAATPLLDALKEIIGPWAIAGPSRAAAQAALLDTRWQAETRRRLATDSARLASLLSSLGEVRTSFLFAYLPVDDAATLADFLARRGILVRRFEHALRFGLPAGEPEWTRLAAALDEWQAMQPAGRA